MQTRRASPACGAFVRWNSDSRQPTVPKAAADGGSRQWRPDAPAEGGLCDEGEALGGSDHRLLAEGDAAVGELLLAVAAVGGGRGAPGRHGDRQQSGAHLLA